MIFTFGNGGNENEPIKNEYSYTSTTAEIAGNELGTMTGCGFIAIKRTTNKSGFIMRVFIDGATSPFSYGGTQMSYFYFNKSIRFDGGRADDIYFYQIRLADKQLDAYRVQQGVTAYQGSVSINGKGKVLVTASASTVTYFDFDGGSMITVTMGQYEVLMLEFSRYINLSSNGNISYIAYLDKSILPY